MREDTGRHMRNEGDREFRGGRGKRFNDEEPERGGYRGGRYLNDDMRGSFRGGYRGRGNFGVPRRGGYN